MHLKTLLLGAICYVCNPCFSNFLRSRALTGSTQDFLPKKILRIERAQTGTGRARVRIGMTTAPRGGVRFHLCKKNTLIVTFPRFVRARPTDLYNSRQARLKHAVRMAELSRRGSCRGTGHGRMTRNDIFSTHSRRWRDKVSQDTHHDRLITEIETVKGALLVHVVAALFMNLHVIVRTDDVAALS